MVDTQRFTKRLVTWGAGCGKAARPDLRGVCLARGISTRPPFKHATGPAAMLTKSPKFTYCLAGHTLPLGAVLLRRKYKCGRFSTFAGRFFPTNRKNFRLSSIDLAISPGWPTMLRQTVGEFCPLWEYSDSHGSMFERSEFAYGTVHRRRTRRGKICRVCGA